MATHACVRPRVALFVPVSPSAFLPARTSATHPSRRLRLRHRAHPHPRAPFALPSPRVCPRAAAAAQPANSTDPAQPPAPTSAPSRLPAKSYRPDPPPSPGPVISASAARSALGSLFVYFRALCREQPFISARLAAAIVCVLLSKLLGLTVPFLFKRAIDSLSSAPPAAASPVLASALRSALIAIVLHGAARILASLTHELRNGVFAKAGQRIGRAITASAFAHLHSMDVAFHTSSRTGALTRVVDRGTRSVMTIFRALLFSFVPTFFELVLVCAVLFARFSLSYVAIVLATFVAFTAWTLSVNDVMGRTRAEMNAAENEASARLTDSLLNVEAVKAFANAPLELSQYDDGLARYERTAVRNEWLYGRLNMGQNVSYTIGLTALLALAARDVVAGQLSVGSIVLLATMVQRLWIPLDFLGWQYREVKQSLIDVQNLFDVLAIQPAIVDAPDARPLQPRGGEIVFDNVSFEYPDASDVGLPFLRRNPGQEEEDDEAANAGMANLRELDEDVGEHRVAENGNVAGGGGDDAQRGGAPVEHAKRRRPALDRVSFTVPAGKSVALVGSSGSGKSTATRLLYRLYDLTGGRILIDGQDIRKATISSLRQAVSIVPQDTSLFNDTIAYNIRYGRPEASDEEVVAAAKAASIHDVIERTSNGYATMVGERGVRLSGGERQRLSVARAFLKGSCVIIEDESTSALDTLTELQVSQALERLGANRSRLIVAHRLSTIMHVDWVVVLQHGRKVEEGPFDELVQRRDGVFRGMWERQQRKGARDADADAGSDDGISVVSDEEKEEEGGEEESEEEKRVREAREGGAKGGADGMHGDSKSGDDADGRIDGDLALDGGGRWRA